MVGRVGQAVFVILGIMLVTFVLLQLTGDPARLARIRAAKMPPITKPVVFHTPEADAILTALEVYPPDNPWNLVVENWPLHPNSKRMIASSNGLAESSSALA